MKQVVGDVRKYLFSAILGYKNRKAFWGDYLDDVLVIPVRFAVLNLIWSTIFKVLEVSSLGGMTKTEIVMYYCLLTILGIFSTYFKSISNVICRDILQGNLTRYICRPINYLIHQFFYGIGYNVFTALLAFVCLLVIEILTEYERNGFFYFILGGVVVINGVIITFFVNAIIGMIAFWTDVIYGYKDLILHIGSFFSGAILPLSMFPEIINKLSLFLPFRYMVYDAVLVFIRVYTCEQVIIVLRNQIICIVVLFLIVCVIWKRGVSKYEAFGG